MRALVLSLTVCIPAIARAEQPGQPTVPDEAVYQTADFISEPPKLPEGWQSRGVWRLDLQEALRRTAENNLGIVLQRESLTIAKAGVDLAHSAYEPEITARYSHSEVDVVPQSSVEGEAGEILTFKDDGWSATISELFPTGTRLSAWFRNGRSRSNVGTAVQPLNYRSTAGVEVSQPLLRGFSTDLDIPRIEILRARLSSQAARDELAVQMTEVLQRTEIAYWDVVQALQRYQVQNNSLELARAQMLLTKRQIDDGILAPADLINAESTLAQRQLQLVEAEAEIERSWDALRRELNLPRGQWDKAIVPVAIPRFEPVSVSTEEALRLALANRPEIHQQDLDIERAVLDLRQAENDRLPQVDLGFSYETVGQDDEYSGALDQLAGLEAPGWTAMVTLSWTPLQRRSRAAVAIQKANQRIAQTRKQQRVLDLYRSVRDAVRNLESAARQVQAAGKFRDLAEKSLDAEQRRFLSGISSNFLVAERQAELAQAQLAELAALLAHQKARLALDRETGRLLETRHIQLD